MSIILPKNIVDYTIRTRELNMKKLSKPTVDELLDDFDFDKVHDIMALLGWKWADVGLPAVEELKSVAKRLVVSVLSGRCIEAATGGFRAYKEIEEGDEIIVIDFVLESSSHYI